MDETTFDTVIVGGGTAGCILAARLSEDPSRSVLLLEAGPDVTGLAECPASIRDEMGYPFEFMWNYDALPTEHDDHHTVAFRGRAMGGSGSVNGMIYARGDPEDYDSWGSALWTSAALAPVFARIERDLDFPDEGRRAGGQVPLRRLPREEWAPSEVAFLRAAVELGHEELDDLLPNDRDGAGSVARNSQDGVRMSMAHCYLNPVRGRPNLTVRAETTAARVLVEDGRAVGVEVLGAPGRETIGAREVILAAGGIGSPHLLTLSGIGPRDVLERLGIPVVLELPGVARNLTDHAILMVIATLTDGAGDGDPRPLAGVRYTAPGSSLDGDMHLLCVSGDFSVALDRADPAGTVHACIFCVLHRPESVGEIEVLSDDPTVLPLVRLRYLDSEHDLARLRHAARHAVDLLHADAFTGLIAEIVSPVPEALASDEALTHWIETTVDTFYHGAGTCRMGAADDPDAVVDERGRVLGIDGLRVMDCSIAPTVVRAPTNATAMAIAERMAQLFLEEAGAIHPAARSDDQTAAHQERPG